MEIGVLIVDDQKDMRALIRLIIETANDGLFVSGEAADGQEALDRVDECDPRVVVLDQMMPGINGVETAELIRSHRPGQAMILCSAYLDDELSERAAMAGITVSLPKERCGEIPKALHRLAAQSA